MKKMIMVLLAVGAIDVFASPPSFDCSKIDVGTERIICDSESLSALDVRMSDLYKSYLAITTDKKIFKNSQREWIKNRNLCTNTECLLAAYQIRLDELNKLHGMKSDLILTNKNSILADNGGKNGNKKLIFSLVYGDSYPVCQSFVDMLNDSQYSTYPSCDRKILSHHPLFKSIDWIEITEVNEIIKIIKKMRYQELVSTKNLRASNLDDYLKDDLKSIFERNLRLFEFVMDYDGDKINDHIYKSVKKIGAENTVNQCNYHNYFYLDASSLSLEKLKSLNKSPFWLFNLSGDNDLFLVEGKIYSNHWGTVVPNGSPSLDLYWNKKICGISVN